MEQGWVFYLAWRFRFFHYVGDWGSPTDTQEARDTCLWVFILNFLAFFVMMGIDREVLL